MGAKEKVTDLTFATLRRGNLRRLPEFKNAQGERAHSEDDGSDWGPAEWFEAVIGELGEYADERRRHAGRDALADELADVVIYLDILAFQIDVDLADAIETHLGVVSLVLTFTELRFFTSMSTEMNLWDDSPHYLEAIVAELGQFANTRKKVNRNDFPLDKVRGDLAARLARTMAYLDLVASLFSIDLGDAIEKKWNATSKKIGSNLRIGKEGVWQAQ